MQHESVWEKSREGLNPSLCAKCGFKLRKEAAGLRGLAALIESYNIGITTHTSIYKNILNEQANYYVALGTPLNKKAKATTIQLTADNALEMIFNEYSGNPIKKAIDHALEKKRNEQHNSDEQLVEVEADSKYKELIPV